MSTTEDNVQNELANERLDSMITTLHEATATTALNANAITAECERNALLEILVDAGLCTPASYTERVSENVKQAIGDLAEAGLIDVVVDGFGDIVPT